MTETFAKFVSEYPHERLIESLDRRFTDRLTGEFKLYTGVDRISSAHSKIARLERVVSILRRMAKRGRKGSASCFTVSPSRRFSIAKPKGGKRFITAPTINSIIFQTPTAEYIATRLDPIFCESSFAYRKGRSAKAAVKLLSRKLENQRWVLDADIQSFFDTVSHDRLLELLTHHFGDDKLLHTLVRRFLKAGWLDHPVRRTGRIRSARTGYTPRRVGLPQGGVLSGVLANLFLHELDCMMWRSFPTLTYIRYADDFIVLGQTQAEILEAYAAVSVWLYQNGLTMHPAKTRILNVDNIRHSSGRQYLDFLGYRFKDNHVIISPTNFKKMKNRLSEVIHKWKGSNTNFSNLIWLLNRRINGKLFEDDDPNYFRGLNWTRYFSEVSHVEQFKQLDSWLNKRLMHEAHNLNVPFQRFDHEGNGLRTFVGLHFQMRRLSKKKMMTVVPDSLPGTQ